MASIFIASLTYTVPIEQVDAVLADHLAWLKAGHDTGHFLAWGPREPRDGGLIFVRAASRAEAGKQPPHQSFGVLRVEPDQQRGRHAQGHRQR